MGMWMKLAQKHFISSCADLTCTGHDSVWCTFFPDIWCAAEARMVPQKQSVQFRRHKHSVLTTSACMPFSPVPSQSSTPFTSLIIHGIIEANTNCRSELVPFPVTVLRPMIGSLWNWRSTYVLCKLHVIMNVCQHIKFTLQLLLGPLTNMGARSSALVEALRYKPEGRGFETRWGKWIFFTLPLILPAALGPAVYSASNRNEFQKQKIMFLGSKRGQCEVLTTLPPSLSRLSRAALSNAAPAIYFSGALRKHIIWADY
jgi:hypothetical protein